MGFEIRWINGKESIFEDGNQITEDFNWIGEEGIAIKDGEESIYEYKITRI